MLQTRQVINIFETKKPDMKKKRVVSRVIFGKTPILSGVKLILVGPYVVYKRIFYLFF